MFGNQSQVVLIEKEFHFRPIISHAKPKSGTILVGGLKISQLT